MLIAHLRRRNRADMARPSRAIQGESRSNRFDVITSVSHTQSKISAASVCLGPFADHRPGGRMVARLLPAADFTIDPGLDEACRGGGTQEQMIDP